MLPGDGANVKQADHSNLKAMLRGGPEPPAEWLNAALKAFDRDIPKGLDALLGDGRSLVRSPREHMGVKEREAPPVARACLKDDDWKPMQWAFAKNTEPVFGEHIETGFRAFIDRITR